MKIIVAFCIFFTSIIFAQQNPAAKQTKAITVLGATAHLGNGKVIKNSVITFENGVFTMVEDATLTKKMYKGKIIKVKDKHIYPGFIAPNSTLGLIEIDAVKATRDLNEIGTMNPHIRSIIAYNTESKVTETAKANGVLIGQITPRGGSVSGTSSVVQFDAWNYEDAAIKIDDGIHLNWPKSFKKTGWWANSGPILANKKYNKQVANIYAFFEDNLVNNTNSVNLKNNALIGLLTGLKALFVHANSEKEMVEAINFKEKFKIKRMIFIGGFDAYKITDLLKKHNIAIILKRIHSLPTATDQDIKLPFKLPKNLDDAGVLVALDPAGDMERMQTRNLPFYAGTSVAYGLDYEKAVAMLTSNAAKILKIDDKYGTIENGKTATFIISDGDALNMSTNNITYAFINGRAINLDTHQKKLYRKFKNKYKK